MGLRIKIPLMCLLLCSASAFAGGLPAGQIAADAKWVAHMDIAGALKSGLGKFALGKAREQNPDFDRKIKNFTEASGVDPLKDLTSATVYGRGFSPGEGVLILRGTFDRKKLLEMLEKNAPDHATSTYGKYTVHTWTDANAKAAGNPNDTGQRVGTFYNDGTILVAQEVKELQHAIDVMDAKAEALPKDSSLMATLPAGTILYAAADAGENNAEAAAQRVGPLKMLSRGWFLMGQNEDGIFVKACVVTHQAEDAKRIQETFEGLRAMLAMAAENDSGNAQLQSLATVLSILNSVKMAVEGTTVTAEVSFTQETAEKAFKELSEAKAAAVEMRAAP